MQCWRVFTVPGDGEHRLRADAAHAAEADYAGWLVVEAERDPRTAHPLTYARLGYRNLHARWWRRRGSWSRIATDAFSALYELFVRSPSISTAHPIGSIR
jgi:hypothetical protein